MSATITIEIFSDSEEEMMTRHTSKRQPAPAETKRTKRQKSLSAQFKDVIAESKKEARQEKTNVQNVESEGEDTEEYIYESSDESEEYEESGLISSDEELSGHFGTSSSNNEEEEEADGYDQDGGFVCDDKYVEYDNGKIGLTKDDPGYVKEMTKKYVKKQTGSANPRDQHYRFLHYIISALADPDYQEFIDDDDKHGDLFVVRRIYKQVDGTANSLFVSDAWNDAFIKNIKTLPYYNIRRLDIAGSNDMLCEICNRRHYFEPFEMTLFGKRYSVEDFKANLEEDPVDPSDIGSYIVSYVCGMDCYYRSSQFHALTHYVRYLTDDIVNRLKWFRSHQLIDDPAALVKRILEDDEYVGARYGEFKALTSHPVEGMARHKTAWFEYSTGWKKLFECKINNE
jgi:hypothetical protein